MPYVPCIQTPLTLEFFVDTGSTTTARLSKVNSSQYEPIWKAEFERE